MSLDKFKMKSLKDKIEEKEVSVEEVKPKKVPKIKKIKK